MSASPTSAVETPAEKCVCCGNRLTRHRPPEHPRMCWSCAPDERNAYPVIVTQVNRHVVWAYADNPAQAADQVAEDPAAYIDEHATLADFDLTAEPPADADGWELVYEGGDCVPWDGLGADAHVTMHRLHLAELAAARCADAGHPDAHPSRYAPGQSWCPVCHLLTPTVERP